MGTGGFKATARGERIDWRAVRDTISLPDVATRLLGPAPGRLGERSARRLWWHCPFHQDSNPSLCIRPGGRQWRCWGCGAKGDAIELVRRLNPGWTFPEAVAYATGRAVPSGGHSKPSKRSKPPAAGPAGHSMPTDRPPAGPSGKAAESPPDGPTGLPLADALALVDEAAKTLWRPEGRAGLRYLIESRGLSEATIRAARLGWTTRADGVPWKPPGVVIPWHDAGRLALVKIRPPAEWRERFPEDRRAPKYIEAFRDRPALFPGPEAIRPGMPLIIVEGEFDAVLLGQELADLASVVTLGSSSSRPEGALYLAMLRCPRWYAALDADPAGNGAAAEWPSRAVRVRPPIELPAGKDWGDVWKAGIDLHRWWVEEVLADAFDREERAAIIEFDADMSREAAERAAGLRPSRGSD
jgi:DNA primase